MRWGNWKGTEKDKNFNCGARSISMVGICVRFGYVLLVRGGGCGEWGVGMWGERWERGV